MNPPDTTITQEALDRLERNLDNKIIERDSSLEKLINQRLSEHERRLGEMNNAHEKAIEAKRLSDEAATRIAERAVTKQELETWKLEVNKRLDLAAGAAKTWALLGAVMGSVIAGIFVGLITRFLFYKQ
jgi:hypothetical protein